MSAMTWPVLHNNPVQYNKYSIRYPLFGVPRPPSIFLKYLNINTYNHTDPSSKKKKEEEKSKHLNKNPN